MRKVNRQRVAIPRSLQSEETKTRRLELRRHFALPPDIRGHRRAPFAQDTLLVADVVYELNQLFHYKCAYCEILLVNAEVSIDHFRPISAATDGSNHVSPDHYGWFAYEWQNLLLLCARCQKAKRNLFPIAGPRAQVLCTWQEATDTEAAELLDPCVDNPIKHLRLRSDGQLEPKTARGQVTIEVVDLNRSELVDRRRQLINSLVSLLEEMTSHNLLNLGTLNSFLCDEAEFAGIARLFFHSVYDRLNKIYRVRRFPSSDFERTILELLEAVPSNEWAQAVRDFLALDYLNHRSYIARKMPHASDWMVALEDDRTASRYVSAISLKNFKGFDEIDIELSRPRSRFQAPCAILLGENATGKSTILQAICLALIGAHQRKQIKTEPNLYISREPSSWFMVGDHAASVTVHFDDGTEAVFKVEGEPPQFVGDDAQPMIVLAYGARRIFKVGHTDVKSSAAVNRTLFDPFAIIADSTAWLQRCSNEQFAAVARAMNEILVLQTDDHIYRDINGNVVVRAHGRDTPIQYMSDGYKSLFAMTIDIMRRMVERWGNLEEARGIVLIDEIETHLHPRWKMQVITALRRSMPQVQFIATTHDPLCLRGMLDGEIHVLTRSTDNRIVGLSNLPSAQGLRTEQLLTSDYFGLSSTSDPEFERLLERYAATIGAGSGSEADRALIDKLGKQISEMTVIGDTPAQQVISEALARYLAKPRAAIRERRELREEAILAVLAALETAFNNPEE